MAASPSGAAALPRLLMLLAISTGVLLTSMPVTASPKRSPGSLLVELIVSGSPERDSDVDVVVIEPYGPTRHTRSDARGRAFFPSLPRGWYVVCAPGGKLDTVGAGVASRETTRVVLFTHDRIPGLFR